MSNKELPSCKFLLALLTCRLQKGPELNAKIIFKPKVVLSKNWIYIFMEIFEVYYLPLSLYGWWQSSVGGDYQFLVLNLFRWWCLSLGLGGSTQKSSVTTHRQEGTSTGVVTNYKNLYEISSFNLDVEYLGLKILYFLCKIFVVPKKLFGQTNQKTGEMCPYCLVTCYLLEMASER